MRHMTHWKPLSPLPCCTESEGERADGPQFSQSCCGMSQWESPGDINPMGALQETLA